MIRYIRIGYVVSSVMMILIGVATYRSTVGFEEAVDRQHHSHAVIGALENVLKAALDAETSARGYALTGYEPFLEPYRTALGAAHQQMDRLRRALRDHGGQPARFDTLKSLIEQRLASTQRMIELRRAGGLAVAAQQVGSVEDRQIADGIRRTVAEMEGEERLLLREADGAAASRARATKVISVLLSGFTFLVLAWARRAVHQEEKRRLIAEENLRRLASIVESSDDAIISKTPEGIITSWNSGAERIYGYTKDEAVGHSVSMLVPPEGQDELSKVLVRMRQGERGQHFEATRQRKNGQRVVLSLTITPIHDGSGRIVAASMISRDVTERKAAEMEIQQLNEALSKKALSLGEDIESFSYSVSHDLRAPLRYMEGFLDLLKNHIGGSLDEKGLHYLDTALESARQMGALIDDLLSFSRTGRVELSETKVILADLVKQAQQELAADLKGRKVVWTVEALPEVAGDPVLLRQVLVNLLGNAVKYTRTRAEAAIEIGCRGEAGEWVFFVRDNGVGFDMRYGHKLFGVFQRLHGADEFEGTGIGLAIARRVIARHGGRTWAEGVVGQGATFYFSLPKAAAAEASDTGASAVSQSPRERSSPHGVA
jgi:PAS domain S-box-containing protein